MFQSAQAPSSIVMIRPHYFYPNVETANDNTFQRSILDVEQEIIWQRAKDEVSNAAETLKQHGVNVLLFEDTKPLTPDSVFPNNWFSTHADGKIILYPMSALNRRKERREDIIARLHQLFEVTETFDLSSLEKSSAYLEGTGAMVLDHNSKTAFSAISNRANPETFLFWCNQFGYTPISFSACDQTGVAIYHTNVLMCIATDFTLVGLNTITDLNERSTVKSHLEMAGKTIIPLSSYQISQFAGNAIELQSKNGRILALSETAFSSLNKLQTAQIEKSAKIVPMNVPTIEAAGGSIRCMIAGIHLKDKQTSNICAQN